MMKTENNIENKRRFAALYWGQRVHRHVTWSNISRCAILNEHTITMDNYHLELKPLSAITDDDAIKVFKILFPELNKPDDFMIEIGGDWARCVHANLSSINKNIVHMIDYLRSRSYALPWLDLSVDDLISYGWIKLKES